MTTLRKNIKFRIGVEEYIMDEYVKNIQEKKTKDQTERYWIAIHTYRVLNTILRDSK